MFLYSIIFFIAILVLIKSGTLVVKSLVTISRYLKISQYITAFIFMAIATSLPELSVGISSALNQTPNLSLGDIIGSNIVNLTLVLGLIIIFARGIAVKAKIAQREAWNIFYVAVLPLLLMWDRRLSRIDGVILLCVFLWYLSSLLRQKERFTKALNAFEERWEEFKAFLKAGAFFLLGIGLLLGSAWVIVWSVTRIALEFDLPLVLVGLFLVAVGTSLPELVFGVRSVLAKRETMNIGNLLGSTVANSTLVLGLVAAIYPIEITEFSLFVTGAFFMVLSILIFNVFLRTRSRLSYREGVFLVVLYVLFVIIENAVR